ncbi:MAG TPA: response regulator transcription factor [Candidatus Acidoferrales bacterium]|nr:response regulator transcription factor [Candidatus Acidoferrales bacterium]
MPPSTVLIVDDFEPFRRLVCSILKGRSEFRVIAQASDGLQAVQKAEEHQPDLILLDIGLPILNGMMVARRVRKLAPTSRILFLTQDPSPAVVQEALDLGALGCVRKPRAHSDLLPAIEAVLRGTQFVSQGLAEENRPKRKMCYSFDFDPKNRILRFCLKGRITDELMKDFHEGMKKPASVVQPDAGVVDISTVISFEVSSQAIRELVEASPIMPNESPRVVIAPTPSVHGLMRMYETEVRWTRPNFHVVRADREAWAILGVQNPQFEPLDTK